MMNKAEGLCTACSIEPCLEHDPKHHLSAEEDAAWKVLKREPNTRADWIDLNATLVGYRRRYIQRHRTAVKPKSAEPPAKEPR